MNRVIDFLDQWFLEESYWFLTRKRFVALAIVGILIAAVVLLSGRSQKRFDMDELYDLLD